MYQSSKPPEMSIVIGTRNRPDAYIRFIQSFYNSIGVTTELIITDASEESTYAHDLPDPPENKIQFLDRLTIIHEKPRVGTLRGYNVAFRKACGRYVTWFNDDCELEPGWDVLAIEYMDEHPEMGIGAVYFKDRCGEQWQKHYCLQHWQGMHYANFGVVRREIGDQVGWFDERIGSKMYGCDNSICLNVLAAGFAVAPIPGCKCKHWRTLDSARQENNANAGDDGQKLGIFWRGDYSIPQQVEKTFAYLRQPTCID